MQRCIPRILPPWTWRAMGSMDLRSSALNWPTMELKKCSRGSLRAKHPRNWSWNAWSSSRNPSTSHGVRSNCGRENPSSSVRCAGNICCLLVVVCAFGGSVDREKQPVKHRCRCRVNHLTSSNYTESCEAGSVAIGDNVPGWSLHLRGGETTNEGEIVVVSKFLSLGDWRDEGRTRA